MKRNVKNGLRIRVGAGKLAEIEPEFEKGSDEIVVLLEAHGFDGVGVGTEFEGLLNVGGLCRGTEDVDGQQLENGIVTDPLEDLKAGSAGHFQVQEEQGGCVLR